MGRTRIASRVFETTGLGDIREHRHSEMLAFRSEVDIADAVLLGGPVALAVKRFGAEVWDEVRREFLRSVSDFREPDGSYRIPGEFATVAGSKPPD